jgi:coenzyme F420-reducing hydrogenase gamma subunit
MKRDREKIVVAVGAEAAVAGIQTVVAETAGSRSLSSF